MCPLSSRRTPCSASASQIPQLLRPSLTGRGPCSPAPLPLPFLVTAGDVDHIDLSVYAFEKLADLKWGVIAL